MMTSYPFTAKGRLPGMRARMSMSMELTSHKKADLWRTQAMPSKHAHSCLNLSERPDLGSGKECWFAWAFKQSFVSLSLT